MAFIHEHRSSESNFEKLFQRLEAECEAGKTAPAGNKYLADLDGAKEKSAAAYRQMKEKGGSAWPEFEKFVTQFEKAVTGALKEA